MIEDLITVCAKMIIGFRSLGLEPPEAIMLKSHDDGMRIISELSQKYTWMMTLGDQKLGHPVDMPDGSVWMEIKVYDLKIRWPALRYALPDGGYRWS